MLFFKMLFSKQCEYYFTLRVKERGGDTTVVKDAMAVSDKMHVLLRFSME